MKYSSFIFSFLGLFALVSVVAANGLAGQRLEKEVGSYVIDIGTDQEYTPQAGAPIKFDFNLLNSGRSPTPFTDVNVRVIQNGKPLVESDIAYAISGPTFFTFAFPTGGSYALQTTFYDKDKQLADASFPLTIGGDSAPSSGTSSGGRYLLFGIIIGAFIGLAIGFFVSSSFRKKTV